MINSKCLSSVSLAIVFGIAVLPSGGCTSYQSVVSGQVFGCASAATRIAREAKPGSGP